MQSGVSFFGLFTVLDTANASISPDEYGPSSGSTSADAEDQEEHDQGRVSHGGRIMVLPPSPMNAMLFASRRRRRRFPVSGRERFVAVSAMGFILAQRDIRKGNGFVTDPDG